MKKTFLLLPVTIYLLFISTPHALADSSSISVEPSKIFLKQNLPIQRTLNLKILNNSQTSQNISITKKEFNESSGNLIIKEPDYRANEALEKVIVLIDDTTTTNNIYMSANSSKNIKVALNLTDSITKKDLTFGLLITTIPQDTPEENTLDKNLSAKSKLSLGIFVPIIISPTKSVSEVKIHKFTFKKFLNFESPELEIELENNNSNANIVNAELKVKNFINNTIIDQHINNKILLSNTKTIISDQTERGILSRKLKNQLFFGPYKATLYLKKGGNIVIEKSTYALFIRPKELIVLLLILLITLIVSRRIIKIKKRV